MEYSLLVLILIANLKHLATLLQSFFLRGNKYGISNIRRHKLKMNQVKSVRFSLYCRSTVNVEN